MNGQILSVMEKQTGFGASINIACDKISLLMGLIVANQSPRSREKAFKLRRRRSPNAFRTSEVRTSDLNPYDNTEKELQQAMELHAEDGSASMKSFNSNSSSSTDSSGKFRSPEKKKQHIAGLSETNTCWSHPHLASDFCANVRRYYRQSKVIFGTVLPQIDKCEERESFQSGGNLTIVTGNLVAHATGSNLQDPTGLGRWSSVTLQGKSDSRITTAYRTCSGSIRTALLGSSFACEYQYLRDIGHTSLNPRTVFLSDLVGDLIRSLQEKGHATILMVDANATMDSDQKLTSFLHSCELDD